MKLRSKTAFGGLLGASLLVSSLAYADKAWDQYLGLNAAQKIQLKAADQARNGAVKPAQQDKDASTQNLISQVLGNAGDAVVQPILNQILGDIKTLDGAEETFWSSINGPLTPTQVAKIFLKRHPLKNPDQPQIPKQPNTQPSFNWSAYFGFTQDLSAQLKTADQARNAQLKTIRDEKEAAAEQLNQLVQSNAADSSIQPTLSTLFSDIQTEHSADQTYWSTTLPGFLTPTQEAKLYLHRHAPKGSFNPPPAAPVSTH